MKVNISRITRLMGARGFLHYGWTNAMAIAYGRPLEKSPLVEWIQVGWAGKKGEALFCYCGVSVSKCVTMKGLIEKDISFKLAEDQGRGWTIIETSEAARAWEDKLVQLAPDLAASYATEHATALLDRTQEARTAVAKYLELIGQVTNPSDRRASLEKLATKDIRNEAERLAGWPGVLQVVGTKDIYAVACLSILMFQSRVEAGRPSFFGQDPLENMDLMWRIQLIADHYLLENRNVAPTGVNLGILE